MAHWNIGLSTQRQLTWQERARPVSWLNVTERACWATAAPAARRLPLAAAPPLPPPPPPPPLPPRVIDAYDLLCWRRSQQISIGQPPDGKSRRSSRPASGWAASPRAPNFAPRSQQSAQTHRTPQLPLARTLWLPEELLRVGNAFGLASAAGGGAWASLWGRRKSVRTPHGSWSCERRRVARATSSLASLLWRNFQFKT